MGLWLRELKRVNQRYGLLKDFLATFSSCYERWTDRRGTRIAHVSQTLFNRGRTVFWGPKSGMLDFCCRGLHYHQDRSPWVLGKLSECNGVQLLEFLRSSAHILRGNLAVQHFLGTLYYFRHVFYINQLYKNRMAGGSGDAMKNIN